MPISVPSLHWLTNARMYFIEYWIFNNIKPKTCMTQIAVHSTAAAAALEQPNKFRSLLLVRSQSLTHTNTVAGIQGNMMKRIRTSTALWHFLVSLHIFRLKNGTASLFELLVVPRRSRITFFSYSFSFVWIWKEQKSINILLICVCPAPARHELQCHPIKIVNASTKLECVWMVLHWNDWNDWSVSSLPVASLRLEEGWREQCSFTHAESDIVPIDARWPASIVPNIDWWVSGLQEKCFRN